MRLTNNIAYKQAFLTMLYTTKIWILKKMCQRSSGAIIRNLTNFDLAAHFQNGFCWHQPHLLMLSHICISESQELTFWTKLGPLKGWGPKVWELLYITLMSLCSISRNCSTDHDAKNCRLLAWHQCVARSRVNMACWKHCIITMGMMFCKLIVSPFLAAENK